MKNNNTHQNAESSSTTKKESFPKNPSSLVMPEFEGQDEIFYAQVARSLARLGILAEIPFAIYHALYGQPHIAITALVIIAIQAAVFLGVRRPGYGMLGVHVLCIGHSTGSIVIANSLGIDASYWLFPVIGANYYILPLRSAVIINILVMISVGPLYFTGGAENLRLLACLLLVSIFGLVFSKRVHEQQRNLHKLLVTDLLTDIGNRRAMDKELRDAMDMYGRYAIEYSLLVFDLDFFKTINDKYGHVVGDSVLKEIAQLVKGRLRANDKLFRYGGEEFVIVARSTNLHNACVLAETIRKMIAGHTLKTVGNITVSIGVTELSRDDSIETWFRRADRLLYMAKDKGRNMVCFV